MKELFSLIAILFSVSSFGQTAIDAYNKAIEKTRNKDYAGSLKDYDEAIRLDPKYTDAYFDRGVSKLFLKEYKAAIADFNKALELRPRYVDAYVNRALTKLKMEETKGAIKDLDTAISISPKEATALYLRGQIKILSGDQGGGCTDLHKAKDLGDKKAQKMLDQYCADGGTQKSAKLHETLKLDWPKSEGWRVADRQENKERIITEYLKNDETFKNFTEIGTMMVYPFTPVYSVDAYMNVMYQKAKLNCPAAEMETIDKDTTGQYPWIIFKVECPNSSPESQLWHIVLGKEAMFVNFREVRQAVLPKGLERKWTAFFKTAKVVKQ